MTIEAGRHLGVSAFTVEIGGAMILWEAFIRRALVGLKNILIYEGMMEGKMVLPHQQFVLPGEDDISVKATVGGILYRKAELGRAVDRGDLLAEIVNPITQERQVIRTDHCGVVHDLNVHARVNAGEDVVGVLEFSSCPGRGRGPTAAHAKTIFNEASDRVRLRGSEVFDEALTLQV